MDPIATTGREWRQRHSLTHFRERGYSSKCEPDRNAPPLPAPLLHSEWRRGRGACVSASGYYALSDEKIIAPQFVKLLEIRVVSIRVHSCSFVVSRCQAT